MKALVFNGPGQRAWEIVPDPVLQEDSDVIVRMSSVGRRAENPRPRAAGRG